MQILFITGHRKSGTTLLGNLFDNNDFACVYPTDLSLMYAYFPSFNNNNYTYKEKKSRIKKILIKSLSEKFLVNNIKNKDFFIKKFINIFLKKVTKKNINNIKYLIKLLTFEYSKILNENNRKYFVMKETSADISFSSLFNKKDKIFFIHIIRDPRDNYASLKSGLKSYYNKIGEGQVTLMSSMIHRAVLDFEFIEVNQRYFGEKKYMVIKYEDLILNTTKVMKKICKNLKIKFSKNLLAPTLFGKPAISNSFNKSKVSSINNKSISRWNSDLNTIEKDVINFYFKKYLIKYYNINSSNLNIDPTNLSKFYQRANSKFFFNDSFV
tara:strand:+ start:1591 stop:2565 length:975 start_codon:yes stop_codon:yes gene_type:complete